MQERENAEKVMEIVPGMTVEEIKSLFFNTDALREPPYRIYQLNSDGHRYYYRFDEKGEPEFYPSVTTLLKQVMPTPPALIDWMIKNGSEGSVEKRDLAAAYGTFMHAQFERLIIERKYDFDSVPEKIREYMESENLPEKFYGDTLSRIRKDVLAFAQFVKDYNVKPLAVEIGLVHPQYHYAGCIDLPCEMMDPKTGDVFRAIVDFKSGRKGFFEEHEIQLHLYKMMWNVTFEDVQVTRVFNFSPKDWRGSKPTYNLKDQTDSVNAKKIPALLDLAAIEDEKRDNTLTIVRGQLDLDNGKIADNILTLSLSELIKKKTQEPTPETAGNAPAITKEEIISAEIALGIRNETETASNKTVRRTKKTDPDNVPSDERKSIVGQNEEKLPIPGYENVIIHKGNEPLEKSGVIASESLLNSEIEM